MAHMAVRSNGATRQPSKGASPIYEQSPREFICGSFAETNKITHEPEDMTTMLRK